MVGALYADGGATLYAVIVGLFIYREPAARHPADPAGRA